MNLYRMKNRLCWVVAAADNTGGTAPTAEENKIHTLRVYAFAHIPNDPKDGRLVGYYYTNQVGQASHTFPMDITFYQKDTQEVRFYLVANEEAMSEPGVDKKFTEQTTEKELYVYIAGNGYCKQRITHVLQV